MPTLLAKSKRIEGVFRAEGVVHRGERFVPDTGIDGDLGAPLGRGTRRNRLAIFARQVGLAGRVRGMVVMHRFVARHPGHGCARGR